MKGGCGLSVALQTRASAEFLPRSFVDGACDVLALGPSVFGGVGGGGVPEAQ